MKKKPDTIENIKQKILELKGKEVNLHINPIHLYQIQILMNLSYHSHTNNRKGIDF